MQPRLAQYVWSLRMRSWKVTPPPRMSGRAREVPRVPPVKRKTRGFRALGAAEDGPDLVEEAAAREARAEVVLDEPREGVARLDAGTLRERLRLRGVEAARLQPGEGQD